MPRVFLRGHGPDPRAFSKPVVALPECWGRNLPREVDRSFSVVAVPDFAGMRPLIRHALRRGIKGPHGAGLKSRWRKTMLTLTPTFESAAHPVQNQANWLFWWWALFWFVAADEDREREAERQCRKPDCAPRPAGPRPPAP